MHFIHIPKTGGTLVRTLLGRKKFESWHHTKKPPFDPLPNSHYAFFVRNPISRFVSGFNHIKSVLNFKLGDLKVDELNINNCPAPGKIKRNINQNNKYVYDKEFDYLMNSFNDANHLAEALSSRNFFKKRRAIKLMNYPIEHLYRSIGWYFQNGDWLLKNRRNVIFVGTQENLNNDFKKLLELLNYDKNFIQREPPVIRPSPKTDLGMSERGISNIINWYEKSDYKVLNILQEFGFINADYINKCRTYKYII